MAPRTENGSKDLGAAIRARREELGLTIEEAAQRAGISVKTWGRYEAGSSIRKDKVVGVLRTLKIKALPEKENDVGDSIIEQNPLDGIDSSHEAWSLKIAEQYGYDAASLFAIGSDIILDQLGEDLRELSSRPRGTHVGELGASWLSDRLPQMYLTRYDYEFVYELIRAVKGMRRAAKAKQLPIVHSVMDELAIHLIIEEGEIYYELFDLSLEKYNAECPEGLAYEICGDSDFELLLYDEILPIYPDDLYHFKKWNEQQFNMETWG